MAFRLLAKPTGASNIKFAAAAVDGLVARSASPRQQVVIGSEVVGEFEHQTALEPPFSLLQWRVL